MHCGRLQAARQRHWRLLQVKEEEQAVKEEEEEEERARKKAAKRREVSAAPPDSHSHTTQKRMSQVPLRHMKIVASISDCQATVVVYFAYRTGAPVF